MVRLCYSRIDLLMYRMNTTDAQEKYRIVAAVAITGSAIFITTGAILNAPVIIAIGASSSLVSAVVYLGCRTTSVIRGPFLPLDVTNDT